MTSSTEHLPASVPSGKAAPRSRRQLLRGLVLLLISGLLMTLAFPRYALWFLAPFCLIPFGVCIIRRPMNKRWLLVYYLFGSVWLALNLYWLWPVSFAGTMALSFFCGLYWALFAFGLHRLVVHFRWPATFALPVCWVATEYLRATLFSGFPWFILGNALAPRVVLIQSADLVGVWGLSAWCAMTAGWVLDFLRLPLWQARLSGRPALASPILRLTACFVAVSAGLVGYGYVRLAQHAALSGPRVTVVQDNLPQSLKDSPTPESRRATFDRHIQWSAEAVRTGKPDLIVWSETIVPASLNREWLDVEQYMVRAGLELTETGQAHLEFSRLFNRELIDFSRRAGTPLLVGAPGNNPETQSLENLAILYTPAGGQMEPYYRKRHLVPFGEYVPFKESWPWLHRMLLALTPFEDDYTLTPGPSWTRFAIPSPAAPGTDSDSSYHFGVPICYEDVMPYPCRSFVDPVGGRKQVDFLVSISNDGWYQSRDELDQHLQMDQIRAVENRVPIARSVNSGNSGFIDATGRVLRLVTEGRESHFVTGFATATLPLDARVSLYSRIGDIFPIAVGILAAVAVGWTLVRPRRGPVDPGPAPVIENTQ